VAGKVGADEYVSDSSVDVDEWRDAPVRHRYVHGGFSGADDGDLATPYARLPNLARVRVVVVER
jgi:hypothetical protein